MLPIKYGLIIVNQDLEYKRNKCYASEKINILKYRPTDYCPKYEKEVYMGLCGILLIEENYRLTYYTKDILIWTVEYLEENTTGSVDMMEKEAYKTFSLNHNESVHI